ncbi:MAG TPA: SDR family NAD(P)-dependent oxidoreductase [Bacteroidales bacterium]|nr:SDR family NAD(P)-dependent oxidoreductase [Bacteroidales bacterium]
MNKIALITGATSGIGEAIAENFAKNNIDVIISARRVERLSALKEKLEKNTRARVLLLQMDVTHRAEVEHAIHYLPDGWKKIDILVNNAGLAVGLDKLHEGSIEDWERMIDTNVKGLLYVTREVVPMMIKHGGGHVINIGSTAGREVYPRGNVYCATKHAVDALTKGLRIDTLGQNIKVSQIAPGLVETEFSQVRFKGDGERAEKVYQGYQPLKPEDIANVAYYLTTLPPHVCINDVSITPLAQANSYVIEKK